MPIDKNFIKIKEILQILQKQRVEQLEEKILQTAEKLRYLSDISFGVENSNEIHPLVKEVHLLETKKLELQDKLDIQECNKEKCDIQRCISLVGGSVKHGKLHRWFEEICSHQTEESADQCRFTDITYIPQDCTQQQPETLSFVTSYGISVYVHLTWRNTINTKNSKATSRALHVTTDTHIPGLSDLARIALEEKSIMDVVMHIWNYIDKEIVPFL